MAKWRGRPSWEDNTGYLLFSILGYRELPVDAVRHETDAVARFDRFQHCGVARAEHATRCVRSAEPGGRLAHPCPMSGAFSRCCNSSHTILTLGANVARPMQRRDRCT